MIKARSYLAPPSGFRYNFKNVIEAWSKFCTVNVMKYTHQINSCNVFCDRIGMDYNRLSQTDLRSNTSLSIEQMVLLEKIQHNLYQKYEDRFKNHLGVIQQINAPFTSKPKLKPEVQALIHENHREDLEWLKDEYGIDFLQDYPKMDELSSLPTFENGKATVRDVYKVQ